MLNLVQIYDEIDNYERGTTDENAKFPDTSEIIVKANLAITNYNSDATITKK